MNRQLMSVLTIFVGIFAVASWAQQPAEPKPSLDDTIKMYCAAWSEPDAKRRLELLEKVWAPAGTYTDPTAHVEGRKALADHIAGFMQRTPGARITATSYADVHHRMFRFSWKFVGADGKIVSEGIDFGTLDANGKIQSIAGFFVPTKPL